MDEISSKLGYRIVITSAQISPNEFIPGQDLSYSISFENRGYSRPLHDYRFKLRFISSNGVECVMEDSSVDLSSWYASDTETYTASGIARLPTTMTDGTYNVFLELSVSIADL